MQERERRLLEVLGDGRFHSGEELARALGVSRAAVWKHLNSLGRRGLEVHAVRGRGYRLPNPLELLDPEGIRAQLSPSVQGRLAQLEVFDQIDSTNSYLLTRAKAGAPGGSVCLAERQSAGRGRRGRQWISPFAANLYLSVLWRYPDGPALLSGLSLAVGVAMARALEGVGVVGVGLKWPNDLLWRDQKLGGILLEFGGESSGPCQVVTGVGLNVTMPKEPALDIDQPWPDLTTVLGLGLSRNRL
ncbi:MAG: biotin--[acetyl-CoA-carboxylase] ligase, partial [Candidatus Competibacteraceae bacterium]|nr:biotin--[acetyl-CoA-carboxylase] ligase [Candidatus Competibacteraceae bacterium]